MASQPTAAAKSQSIMEPKRIDILVISNILHFTGTQKRRAAREDGIQLRSRAQAHRTHFPEITTMKKIIALVAVLASAQASAFWGGGPWGGNNWGNNYNNGSGYGNGYSNGTMDGYGDAAGSGDFSMNMSGRARSNMRGYGNGYGAGDGWGRGYNNSGPYGYAPYGYGAPMGYGAPQGGPQAPQTTPTGE